MEQLISLEASFTMIYFLIDNNLIPSQEVPAHMCQSQGILVSLDSIDCI